MSPPDPVAFDQLAEAFLSEEFAANPVLASGVGVTGYDELLPDLTAAGFAARASAEDAWLARFAELGAGGLSAAERIDRDLVVGVLRGRQVMRDWQDWRRNPDTYTGPGLQGVFLLFVHRLRPEPELVAAAAARLRAVPDLLSAGRANLDAGLAAPVLVHRALGQARAGVHYARHGAPALAGDEGGRAELAAAGERAALAYQEFVVFLSELAERATGDFAIGEARYSALLREREGLGYGAGELRERGRAAYRRLAIDLADRAAAMGWTDWRELLAELDRDHPPTPEAMRAAYAEATAAARAFCLDHELVSLPAGESCLVVPSPEFQRPVLAVASYLPPPSFADSRQGHFFVPYPPEGTTADELDQRLSTNSYSSIPTVSVHETWPGHHWHLAWVAASRARPLRRVLRTPYLVEGWALYAEEMLKEQGFFTDPRHELRQVDARLFRAARIVVDTSLHLAEMDVEEAVEHMSTRASLSVETARAEVARYCAWPTQAASYLTGALEIARMRDAWVAAGGGLRAFHDALAGSGGLPIALAERALTDPR